MILFCIVLSYYSILYYPIPYCRVFVLETGWPSPPHLSSIFKVEGVATPIHFSLLRGDDHLLRGMVCDTAERGRCLPHKRDEERGEPVLLAGGWLAGRLACWLASWLAAWPAGWLLPTAKSFPEKSEKSEKNKV